MKVLKAQEAEAQPGIKTTHWFWGTEAFTPKPSKPEHQFTGKDEQSPEKPTADEQAQRILVDTPGISGATMLNAMKAKGLKLVDEKAMEADASTLHPSVTRAGTFSEWKTRASKRGAVKPKESEAPKAAGQFIRARFLESTPGGGAGPHKFRVALIQEGLGNLRDGFYYTREALEGAVAAFEGRKCYADHPSRSEEQDRPERSVRDIIGHFENVTVEESDDGAAMLCADLIMLPDPPFEWARSLVRESLEFSKKYPDKELVGLSINANGDAVALPIDKFLTESKIPDGAKPKLLRAKEQGLSQVRVVQAITDAVSTDLVTEPGARGKVLSLIEGEPMKAKKVKMKQAEDEAKMKHAEDEAKKSILPESAEADGAEDHEDEEQDKALILDMIKKHMGEAAEGMEGEAEAAAMEAVEAYKEMGYSKEEACEAAGHAMKLAKHMAGKQAEAEKCESEAKEEEAMEAEAEEEEKKESEAKHAEADVVKLTARIAFLERELKVRGLAETLDKKLAESGLGRAETDKIRALIGKPRSEQHIVETIKVFKEAFGSRGESRIENLFVVTEKASGVAEKKSGFSFSDCFKK